MLLIDGQNRAVPGSSNVGRRVDAWLRLARDRLGKVGEKCGEQTVEGRDVVQLHRLVTANDVGETGDLDGCPVVVGCRSRVGSP